MKANLIKCQGSFFKPADEQSLQLIMPLTNNEVYEHTIKLNHNYKLLQKIHVFFKFCAQHYYGDMEVDKDQIALTKRNLLIGAGYCKQVFHPNGVNFEIVPVSISYAKMKPEERMDCARKLTSSALKGVFHSADDNTYNQLISFFG